MIKVGRPFKSLCALTLLALSLSGCAMIEDSIKDKEAVGTVAKATDAVQAAERVGRDAIALTSFDGGGTGYYATDDNLETAAAETGKVSYIDPTAESTGIATAVVIYDGQQISIDFSTGSPIATVIQ